MSRYKYKAFISYKHSASREFAERLELAIKQYAKPLWQRPMPIFRDEKYLKPGVDLPGMITAALLESEYFIYLASPDAAQSTWVQQEVEQWMADNKRVSKVIILLTDGQLAHDPDSKEINWEQTDVLALQFRPWLRRVPYYVDCKQFKSAEQQNLSYPAFKLAINAIVAALRNVDPLELNSEEVRQHHRNLLLLRSLFTSIVVLTLGAIGLASFAWHQKNLSEMNARTALSRQLSAQGELIRSTEPDALGRAFWLTTESIRLSPTTQAEETLLRIMELSPRQQFAVRRNDNAQFIKHVEFSPDGRFLLSTSGDVLGDDKVVNVWDVRSHLKLYSFNHDDVITSATFTPDSKYLVSGSKDLSARVWSLDDGRELVRVDHDNLSVSLDGVTTLVVSPNGRLIASAAKEGKLKVWESITGRLLYTFDAKPGVTAAEFSPDSSHIAAADAKHGLVIIDLASGIQQRWDIKGDIKLLGYYGDGKNLLIVNEDGVVKTLELASGRLREKLKSTDRLGQVILSLDGRYLVAGDVAEIFIGFHNTNASPKKRVWVWNLQEGKLLFEHFDLNNIEALAISFDNRLLAVSRGSMLQLWNIDTGKELAIISNGYPIGGTAFSPDGSLLATGEPKGVVRVWQTNTKIERARLSHHGTGKPKETDVIYDITFTPNDGRFLISAGGDGFVKVWEVASGKEVLRLKHNHPVTCISVSRDGRILASATDEGDIRVWRMADGSEVKRFKQSREILSIDLNPTGTLLVSGGFDRTVRLWSVETGEELKRINLGFPIGLVSFSPDGHFFGAARGQPSSSVGITGPISGSNEAKIWDVQTGDQVFSAAHEYNGEPYTSWTSSINDFAFSSDSQTFLTGSEDGTARVWDISKGRERFRVTHADSVREVGFKPFDNIAFSLANDGLKFWRLSPGSKAIDLAEVTRGPIQFNKDGSLLVDGDGQVWNVGAGVLKARFLYGMNAHDIAWSPDDQMIAAAVENDILVWNWKPDGIFEDVCRRLVYRPSKEEWQFFFSDRPYDPVCENLPALSN